MHRREFLTLTAGTALVLTARDSFAQAAAPGDWPQWRGPLRDGVSRETGLLKSWPQGGPKLAWKATNLGASYTTPSVAAGRVLGMGNARQRRTGRPVPRPLFASVGLLALSAAAVAVVW